MKLLRHIVILGWLVIFFNTSKAQNCIPTNINGTVINLACNQVCSTFVFQIPHLKNTTDYTVNTIPYSPYPFQTATPALVLACSNQDDKFFDTTFLPFNFCFYGANYSKLVVSTNGLVTFDSTNALKGSHWSLAATNQLPFTGTGAVTASNACATPSGTLFPRAAIFGAYYDIYIDATSSPNRKMEARVEGVAPCRKFVVSFNEVPLFSCTTLWATQQIVLHESTGIVEVFIRDKPSCTFNGGLAVLGMQDWSRTKAVWAPGKNCSVWTESNTGYRFTPSGFGSRYMISELLNMSGTVVSTADTSTSTPGLLDIAFTNYCPPAGNNQFVVRTTFSSCDNVSSLLTVLDTISINTTNGLNATVSATSTFCGPPGGTITVTVPAGIGTSPYTFVLDGGAPLTGSSPQTFVGVASGPHTVVVTDASGICTSTYQVTVDLISSLTATTTNSAVACTGVNNGTIIITSSNGTGPFSYSLDGAAYVSGPLPYTFSNLTPGNHTVVVRDVNNCVTNTIPITISTGAGITSFTSVTASACGTPTGQIVITPSGGSAPYTYQLGTGPIQPSNTFSGLAPGTYSITIRDNIGCLQTISRTITSLTTISANFTTTGVSCSGASNGSVVVTPTNGVSPYNFSIDGGTVNAAPTSYTFTNLSVGTHSVTITDAAGCVRNANISIGNGPVFTATANPIATTCSGAANGTIMVNPNGGTAPFSFTLDGGTAITAPAPYTFTGVPAGIHTIVVRDGGGCVTNTVTVIVSNGPAFVTTVSSSDAMCNGSPTGVITVAQPASGLAPFGYSLDGITWQASNIFNGIAAGNYTVYYRDAGGCQGSQSITVNEASAMVTSASAVPVICNGQSNGIINVTANGGNTPYQYSIDGGTTWQNNNVFNVIEGSHTITIRDANNCISNQTINVTEPAALAASSANGPASCDGGNDGLITVTANGGNTGYQYSIDGITFQASNVFNVGPGSYTVTVRDNLGCTTSFPTTVLLGSNFALTNQPDVTICEGTSTQLALTSNATQYSWTPAATLSNANIANPVANPTATTQYIVTATLGRCSGNDTVIVNVNPAPIPNAGPDGFICYGQTYQLQASGGTQYSWSPSTYLSNTSISNPVSAAGRDITYTLSILSDINGCASLTTDQINIDVTPPLKVKTFPSDTIGYSGDQIQLLAVPSDRDVINYVWTPSTGLNDPTIPNPIVTLGATGDVTQYQVFASTIAGCRGEGYVTVKVYKGPDIYVPSGFTPNNDGRNDRFTPFPVGMKSYNYFRVFNRWGQLVFSTRTLHDGWDGKLGGRDQQSGIYVWMIEGTTNDGRLITKKGTIALIR